MYKHIAWYKHVVARPSVPPSVVVASGLLRALISFFGLGDKRAGAVLWRLVGGASVAAGSLLLLSVTLQWALNICLLAFRCSWI
jgi:hypothetical protein